MINTGLVDDDMDQSTHPGGIPAGGKPGGAPGKPGGLKPGGILESILNKQKH